MHGLGRSLGWNQACVLCRETLRFLRLEMGDKTMAREEAAGALAVDPMLAKGVDFFQREPITWVPLGKSWWGWGRTQTKTVWK